MRVSLAVGLVLIVSGTAAADPDGRAPESRDEIKAHGPPRVYVAGGGAALFVDGETWVTWLGVDAGTPLAGPLWVTGRIGRAAVLVSGEEVDSNIHSTEVGAGLELRTCPWPWLACAAVGLSATTVIDDDGHVGIAAWPYLEGEIGLGAIALRAGLVGRFGREGGVGTSSSIVLRF